MSGRRAAKVDANQHEIVAALRAVGCSVQSIATVGHGCPDLLVGLRGMNWLMEVKDRRKPPSQRKLTPMEAAWAARWRGLVHVVECVEDALAIVQPRGLRVVE